MQFAILETDFLDLIRNERLHFHGVETEPLGEVELAILRKDATFENVTA